MSQEQELLPAPELTRDIKVVLEYLTAGDPSAYYAVVWSALEASDPVMPYEFKTFRGWAEADSFRFSLKETGYDSLLVNLLTL